MTYADSLVELLGHLHQQGYVEGVPGHIPPERMAEDRLLSTRYLCRGCSCPGLGRTLFFRKGDLLASVFCCRVCGVAEIF